MAGSVTSVKYVSSVSLRTNVAKKHGSRWLPLLVCRARAMAWSVLLTRKISQGLIQDSTAWQAGPSSRTRTFAEFTENKGSLRFLFSNLSFLHHRKGIEG